MALNTEVFGSEIIACRKNSSNTLAARSGWARWARRKYSNFRAFFGDCTLIASRSARVADLSTMQNQAHRKWGPLVGGQQFAHLRFDLVGVSGRGEAQAMSDAPHVGVYYEAGLAEHVAEEDIGGFATDPGKGH